MISAENVANPGSELPAHVMKLVSQLLQIEDMPCTAVLFSACPELALAPEMQETLAAALSLSCCI